MMRQMEPLRLRLLPLVLQLNQIRKDRRPCVDSPKTRRDRTI